jgi:hypothetical protein
MAFLTVGEARAVSRSAWSSRSAAETALENLTKSAAITAYFDIFLSHAYEDADLIGGVKILLERDGHSIYVDWIEDAQTDRSRVTPETADLLRERMKHCKFLLFVTSKASPQSKWMPWELGYFDGLKPDKVGIFPLVQQAGQGFVGQEYLGLYPPYELIDFDDYGRQLGTMVSKKKGRLLKSAIA